MPSTPPEIDPNEPNLEPRPPAADGNSPLPSARGPLAEACVPPPPARVPPPPTRVPPPPPRVAPPSASAPLPDDSAPLTFVPHESSGALSSQPLRIQTGRYGALEEHELVSLLGSLADERARARFRESIYISIFFWIAVALLVLYGPHYLWHSPQLMLPSEAIRRQELTQLNMPRLHAPTPSIKQRAQPKPALDNHTLDKLREMARRAPTPPPAPTPTPVQNPPLPSAPTPTPAATQPAPIPPTQKAPVADAPLPQPRTQPKFNQNPATAGDAIQQAIQGASHDPNGGGSASRGGGAGSPLNTGVDILSDTQGVNFDPYIRKILREIYDHWLPLIPEEARPPLSKSGITMVRFSILPDGTIGSMHLDDSTHDDALNRAAWGSIVSTGQFPPLPAQFHGPNLELRIHYLVNKP